MRPLLPAEIERFRAIAEQLFGLAFDEGRLTLLGDVLEHQTRSGGYGTATEYLDRCLLANGAQHEIERLAERLTVGETYFFRNQDQFRALAEVAVPERLAERGGVRQLRLLSAGCASGEEPFSMAMCLRESVPDLATWNVRTSGIDLNPAALEKAASGQYGAWSLRETPDDLRERYFLSQGPLSFRLDPRIQQMVGFERRNLSRPDPGFWRPAEFDVIFCRNVIMYFSPRAARALVARLAESLAPGGFLFLGTAETLRGLSQVFHLRHSHRTFYYQLRQTELSEGADSRPRAASSSSSRNHGGNASPPFGSIASVSASSNSWLATVQQATQRIADLACAVGNTPNRPGIARRPTEIVPAPLAAEATHLIQGEQYGKALDLLASQPAEDPADVDAMLLRAVSLTNQSQPEQAEAICREILDRDDLNAGAHYLMALCREHAGDQAAAIDHDHYALYLDPGFAMPRLHLGLMARRTRDCDMARRELGEALVLLAREDAARTLLLGGGFTREGLMALCRAELRACGGEA